MIIWRLHMYSRRDTTKFENKAQLFRDHSLSEPTVRNHTGQYIIDISLLNLRIESEKIEFCICTR